MKPTQHPNRALDLRLFAFPSVAQNLHHLSRKGVIFIDGKLATVDPFRTFKLVIIELNAI